LFETFYLPLNNIIDELTSHTPEATRFIVIEGRVKQMRRWPIFLQLLSLLSRISCRPDPENIFLGLRGGR